MGADPELTVEEFLLLNELIAGEIGVSFPDHKRELLAARLRPMAGVVPVSLEEARDVLHDRLVTLDWDPPASRYGRSPARAAARRWPR